MTAQAYLELLDRIDKGRAFIDKLAPDDPKRQGALERLDEMLAQAAEFEEQQRSRQQEVNKRRMQLDPLQIWDDPRPDLEDHLLWKRLLKLACNLPDEKEAYQVTGVLHGIRMGGTMLEKGRRGFSLRPVIDTVHGWASPKEYGEMREKYLNPHGDSIQILLEVLRREQSKQIHDGE